MDSATCDPTGFRFSSALAVWKKLFPLSCTWWLGSLVVRALDLLLDGREFDSRPPRLVPGWVTVFGRANHLSISPSHPGQLSLLPSAGREMSSSQSAVTLCGWGIKAGVGHSTCGQTCEWHVNTCQPERYRDERLIIKRYNNQAFHLLHFANLFCRKCWHNGKSRLWNKCASCWVTACITHRSTHDTADIDMV